jgi:hypothetical protein
MNQTDVRKHLALRRIGRITSALKETLFERSVDTNCTERIASEPPVCLSAAS